MKGHSCRRSSIGQFNRITVATGQLAEILLTHCLQSQRPKVSKAGDAGRRCFLVHEKSVPLEGKPQGRFQLFRWRDNTGDKFSVLVHTLYFTRWFVIPMAAIFPW